jgi:tetratricopeptide (TPR) repeat protein
MKKFYAAVGISAVLASGLAGCAATNGVVASTLSSDPYGVGKGRFAAGQFGLALESFQKALDQKGPSVDRLNALGATYDQLARFDLADRAYRQALVLDPESAQTLNNIGYSYLLRGRPDLASAYLAKARSLAKNDARISANLAMATKKMEQPPTVIPASATVAEQPSPVPASVESVDAQPAPAAAPVPAAVTLVNPQQDTYIEPVAHGVYRLVTTNQHIEEAHASTAISTGTIIIPQVSEPMPVIAAVPVSPVKAEPLAGPQSTTAAAPDPVHFSTPARPVAGIIQVAATSSDMSFIPGPASTEGPAAPTATPMQLSMPAASAAGIIGLAATDFANVASENASAATLGTGADLAATQLSTALVEVSNGSGIERSGARFRAYLRSRGIPVRRLTNDAQFGHAETVLFYREGYLEEAQAIADELGISVALQRNDQQRSDVRLRLGLDSKPFDRYLAAGILTASR